MGNRLFFVIIWNRCLLPIKIFDRGHYHSYLHFLMLLFTRYMKWKRKLSFFYLLLRAETFVSAFFALFGLFRESLCLCKFQYNKTRKFFHMKKLFSKQICKRDLSEICCFNTWMNIFNIISNLFHISVDQSITITFVSFYEMLNISLISLTKN